MTAEAACGIRRISVIIANYNYAKYVGTAIESALDLDWPDVEVIVVDDGSTDESREVISAYKDRVQAIFQSNQTQRVARNRGYAVSTGDAIIHLDSDDVLHRDLARQVSKVWRVGVSKVQVQMEVIDAAGRTTGRRFPRFRRTPTPDQMRTWVQQTTAHPTPPGSGNVYSRAFLDQIFPLDDRCGPATDSACLATAALLGDVVTIPRPLVSYRIHGKNTSDMFARPDKFARAVQRARARYLYARSVVAGETNPDERPLFRSRELLQLRVGALRQTPRERPLPEDSAARMLRDAVTTLFAPGFESLPHRLLISAWCIIMIVAPSPLARRLLRLRYSRT